MDNAMTERDGKQLMGSTWNSEGGDVIGKGAQSMQSLTGHCNAFDIC